MENPSPIGNGMDLQIGQPESIMNPDLEIDVSLDASSAVYESVSPKKRPQMEKDSAFCTVERLSGLDHGVDGDTHEKNPIISISVHPTDPTVLATGGHEGTVRLWSVSVPTTDNATLKDPERTVVKLLNTLTGHTSQVNTVRFSPISGDYLASCSSDSTIRIYSKESRWKLLNSLRGHTLDVSDIGWFNESILISCSADCKTIIWDVVTGGKIQTLTSDKGTSPKGVLVDPYRDYFCVLYDESLVDVYRRQADGKFRHSRHVDLAKEDVRNFSKAAKTTIYPRRGSWDPLNQSVILPLGSRTTKNVGPCGVVYERSNLLEPTPGESLLSRKILAGHPARVVVVACTPCMYKAQSKDFHITAMASVDGVVSLWCSDQSLPLAVVANILGPLGVCTDSAWACDKSKATLFLSSSDGGVTSLTLRNIGTQTQSATAPAPLNLGKKFSASHVGATAATIGIGGDVKSAQVETRVGGKRKIQPVVEVTAPPAPITNGTPSTLSSVPTFCSELSATCMSGSIQAKNNSMTNSATLTHSNGWEITWEKSHVTTIALGTHLVVAGVYDLVHKESQIVILKAANGTLAIPQVCVPEYPRLIRVSDENCLAIVLGEFNTVLVWQVVEVDGGAWDAQAVIADAVLTGLFTKDKPLDIHTVHPLQLTLESGRRCVYNVKLARWTIVVNS